MYVVWVRDDDGDDGVGDDGVGDDDGDGADDGAFLVFSLVVFWWTVPPPSLLPHRFSLSEFLAPLLVTPLLWTLSNSCDCYRWFSIESGTANDYAD